MSAVIKDCEGIGSVAVIGNYMPRPCGVSAFTSNLVEGPSPFPHSYWVIPGKFLAGGYPGSEDPAEADKRSKALLDHGARTFIDLMEPWEVNWDGKRLAPYAPELKAIADDMGIETAFYRYGVKNLGVPSRELMILILDCIDTSLAGSRPVYVHCRGRIGRTGTVAGCYLVRHGYASGRDAFPMIHTPLKRFAPDRHVTSPETQEQREMFRSWKEGE
jgi:hypothetical protein